MLRHDSPTTSTYLSPRRANVVLCLLIVLQDWWPAYPFSGTKSSDRTIRADSSPLPLRTITYYGVVAIPFNCRGTPTLLPSTNCNCAIIPYSKCGIHVLILPKVTSSTMTKSQNTSFTVFPKLPRELRNQIWVMAAFEPRVYTIIEQKNNTSRENNLHLQETKETGRECMTAEEERNPGSCSLAGNRTKKRNNSLIWSTRSLL